MTEPTAAQTSTSDRLAARVSELTSEVTTLKRSSEEAQMRQRIAGYGQQLAGEISSAESAVASAERALATAHDDGDGATIASKQRELSEAIAKREGANRKMEEHRNAVSQYEQQLQAEATKPAADPEPKKAEAEGGTADLDYSNLNEWKDANKDWYGVDDKLTDVAHEIDAAIRKAGVISVGSKQYFEAVDRQMAQKFPDRFKRTAQSSNDNGGRSSTSVSGGRIPSSVVEGWQRMGIDTNDKATMERMVKHREVLAHKGILPETPAYGRIRS